MSSGRMPKDSGPHSFNKEWQMLRTAPSLIVDVFENSCPHHTQLFWKDCLLEVLQHLKNISNVVYIG